METISTLLFGISDAIHTSCLVSLIKSLPPHTAPPGYACPTCSTPVSPIDFCYTNKNVILSFFILL